jgi:hypothetical protein
MKNMKHGCEFSASIKCRELLEQLRTCWLLKKSGAKAFLSV